MKKLPALVQNHPESIDEKRRSDAARFKNCLLGNELADFLALMEEPGKSKVPEKYRGKFKSLWPKISNINQNGNAIFMMVNQSDGKGTKDENVIKVNAFFLDYDGDGWSHISLKDLLLKFKHKPHMVVKTSAGHYHVYWLASDCALDKFKGIQKALAAKFEADPKVCNLARVMRMPGTFNHKNSEHKFLAELIHYDESLPRYSAAEFVNGLGLQLEEAPKAIISSHVEAVSINQPLSDAGEKPSTDDIIEWLTKISPEERSTWMDVCMALKSFFGEDGLEFFLQWSRPSSKFDEAEAKRQWDSVKVGGGITWRTLRYFAKQGSATPISNWSRGPENLIEFVALFVQNQCQYLKFSPVEKIWYAYVDGIWRNQQANAEGAFLQYLRDFIRKYPRHPLCNRLASSAGLTEIMRLASTDARCHIDSKVFDASADTIAVETPAGFNGSKFAAVDLTTGKIRAAVPEDFFVKTMGVPYVPGASCPQFLVFLNQIANGDAELPEALCIAFGYAMFGHVQDQVMFVLIGDGANGKGVLLNIIKYVCGEYAATVSYSLLKKHNTNPNAPTPALAPLVGARFVQSSEFGEGEKLEEALVKNITGADPISYRPNYGQQTTFKPQCKIFLSSNYFPRISFEHEAMWRRLFPIRLTKRFTGSDCNSQLEQQLKAEGSGILNWLIEGALKYHRLGKLFWPASTIKYQNSLKQNADTVGTWLKNNCRSLEESVVPAGVAYKSYSDFTKNNKQLPITVQEFKCVMSKKGYPSKRTKSNNVFIGLVIRE